MKIVELQKVPKNKIGRIDRNGVKPKPHEEHTAKHLILYGFNIDFIMPRNTYKAKTADILINGSIWEMKSPTGNGNSTIDRQFHKAGTQSDKLVLDLRRAKLPAKKAEAKAIMRLQKSGRVVRLLLITKDGKVLDIKR